MNTENEITILFADDHQMMRESFPSLFRNTDVKLLATAANGKELLQLVRELQPHVVITDIRMPVMGGEEVTAIIKKEFPQIKVLALTGYDEIGLVKDMTAAGAEGFLIKNAGIEELLMAIKSVHAGRTFYCSYTTGRLLALQMQTEPIPAGISLTNRETEVLVLLCRGHSSKMIAAELKIKTRTVDTHRARLHEKTGLKSVAELVIFAIKHGIV